ncbi:MAG: LysM peptidoglycan-binding domain-containing protein [Gammaproteobacteria bacterium]|nr:MAG: LysM peptidoglycan-binding domain-containing protein [Gammaproteobacteria bacterium]
MVAKHLFGLILALFVTVSIGATDPVELNPAHPSEYTVKKGDTLWDISEMFLKNPWRWPDIWNVNPQIANPHLIYPGDVLSLTYGADGKPRLGLKRGRETVKLSPRLRESAIDQAIPTIPITSIKPFLTRPMVLTQSELDGAAYVVAVDGEHVLAASGDQIYVRKVNDKSSRDWVIMRKGEIFRNPDAKKDDILGYEMVYIANATPARYGDPATFVLRQSKRETNTGDKAFPNDIEQLDTHFTPHLPAQQLEGVILNVFEGVANIGRYDVVAINLGKKDGLESGHVLQVYQAGKTIPDSVTEDRKDKVTLPDESAGIIMVFRTFERVSYALVMRANRFIHTLDKVRTPG